MITEPGRIDATISSETRTGARAPGMRTAPITRSARATWYSIAARLLVTVRILPLWIRSMSRSLSTSRSTMMTSPSMPPLQVMRADLWCHPAGYLAHRGQEGQATVRELHGLVRHSGLLPLRQHLGELLPGREMEVGEQDLALAEVVVLLPDRFLDLQDQVGGAPQLLRPGDDLGAVLDVGGVGDGGSLAGPRLDQHLMAGHLQLP